MPQFTAQSLGIGESQGMGFGHGGGGGWGGVFYIVLECWWVVATWEMNDSVRSGFIAV